MKIVVVLSILCMLFVPCDAMYLSKIVQVQKTKNSYKAPLYNNPKSIVSSTVFKNKFLPQPLDKSVVVLPSPMMQQQIMVMSNKKESFDFEKFVDDVGCIGQFGLGMISLGGIFCVIYYPAALNAQVLEAVFGWHGPVANMVSVICGVGETGFLLLYGANKIWGKEIKAASSVRMQKNHFIAPLHSNTAVKLLSSK